MEYLGQSTEYLGQNTEYLELHEYGLPVRRWKRARPDMVAPICSTVPFMVCGGHRMNAPASKPRGNETVFEQMSTSPDNKHGISGSSTIRHSVKMASCTDMGFNGADAPVRALRGLLNKMSFTRP